MNVTCNRCGWVAFEVTRFYATEQVEKFNIYFDSLPKEQQKQFYNNEKSHIYVYEHCFLCSNLYKDFRDAKNDDCPEGCTLNPIIKRTE